MGWPTPITWGICLAASEACLIASGASLEVLAAFQIGGGLATARVFAHWDHGGTRVAGRAGLLAACFPLVGALGAALMGTGATSAPSGLIAGLEELKLAEGRAANDREALGPIEEPRREYSVWILAESLVAGDADQTLATVAALSRLEAEGGVQALQGALGHANPQTRLIASLELMKLEERLTRSLAHARERLADGEGFSEPLEVATSARRYAASGLARGALAASLWQEAVHAAEAANARARLPGDRLQTTLELARAHRGEGNLKAALLAAESALAIEPTHLSALQIISACHYDLGDYPRWRATAARLGPACNPAAWEKGLAEAAWEV